MPWQTPQYYEGQKKTLRPTTYTRLHENRWSSSQDIFITAEMWDSCIDFGLSPQLMSHDSIFVGVDCGLKHDNAAVVAVEWANESDRLMLVNHRIWRPTPADPLDLESTIEWYLRQLHQNHRIAEIICDPWQLHRSISTLRAAGLPIREFPQSQGNVTLMGQTLFDLLNGRNLRVYPSDELRTQALNTVATESSRGFRISKEKASNKIDSIVALAMACVSAQDYVSQHGRPPSVTDGPIAKITVNTAFDPRRLNGPLLKRRT